MDSPSGFKRGLIVEGHADFASVGREGVSVGEFLNVVRDKADRSVGVTELHTAAVHGASRIKAPSMESDIGDRIVGGKVSVDGRRMGDPSNPAFATIPSIRVDDPGKQGREVRVGDQAAVGQEALASAVGSRSGPITDASYGLLHGHGVAELFIPEDGFGQDDGIASSIDTFSEFSERPRPEHSVGFESIIVGQVTTATDADHVVQAGRETGRIVREGRRKQGRLAIAWT